MINKLDNLSTIMVSNVIKVRDTDSIEHIDSIFTENFVNHLPVINKEEKLVGVISKKDYLSYLRFVSEETSGKTWTKLRAQSFKATEIMSHMPFCLLPDDTIEQAIEAFTDNNFHCIPIVDQMEIVGVVTPYDILKVIN